MSVLDERSPFAKADELAARLKCDLAQSPLFHARLLDAVQEAVIATDLEGQVVYWNHFAQSLYGWTAEEAIGRHVLELKGAPDDKEVAVKVMAGLPDGGTWAGALVLGRRGRSTFPARGSHAAFPPKDGNLIGLVRISYEH